MPDKITQFLQFCVERGQLSTEDVRRFEAASRTSALSMDEILVELGLLRDSQLAEQLREFCGLGMPTYTSGTADLVEELGSGFCVNNYIVPIAVNDEEVVLAVANPFQSALHEIVAFFFEKNLKLAIDTRAGIRDHLKSLQQEEAELVVAGEAETAHEVDAERLKDIALDTPIVQYVNRILSDAVQLKASDIHIEPSTDGVRIRFRRDGLLYQHAEAPRAYLTGLATRIKILSKLSIVERRRPQDGRMRIAVRGEEIDFRVSVIPSVLGETIVLRLLVGAVSLPPLEALGYDKAAADKLRVMSNQSNGILILTGPTGSGKTTTLHSLVSELDRQRLKIFTIEDPVEYRVDGITQLQVDPGIGVDFASALRSVLRQDPDVILIGEIRDRETAQIAMQAALTGHLVLTTLHTNSATGALTRLLDMGVEPFLISATVRGCVGQRLARKTCMSCAGRQELSCTKCHGTQTDGRMALYEVLEVNDRVAALINASAPETNVQEAAVENGMVTIRQYGETLVERGFISAAELARVAS